MAGVGDPNWTAQIDQAKAGLRDFAATMASYFDDLVAAGFTRAEALEIVVAWQGGMLGEMGEDGGP